jgi:hypothetical protein
VRTDFPLVLVATLAACGPWTPALQPAADSTEPEPEPEWPAALIDLAIGHQYQCAVAMDGSVWCRGWDRAWQLGLRSGSPEVPSRVESIEDAVEIEVLSDVDCVRLADGRVSCWGDGGGMRTIEFPRPVLALTSEFRDLCAIADTGALLCWNSYRPPSEIVERISSGVELAALSYSTMCASTDAGLRCFYNKGYVGGRGGASDIDTSALGSRKLVQLELHQFSLLAIDDHGQGWRAKLDRSGGVLSPMPGTGTLREVEIDGGSSQCEVDGDGRVSCISNSNSSLSWAQGVVQGLPPVTEIELDDSSACALSQGRMWCWGQVAVAGDGRELVHVDIPPASSLAIDGARACATTAVGELWCWGQGFLGDGRDPNAGLSEQARPALLARGVSPMRTLVAAFSPPCPVDAAGIQRCPVFEGATLRSWRPVLDEVLAVERRCRLVGDLTRELQCGSTPVPSLREPTAAMDDSGRYCALHDGGKLRCWTEGFERGELFVVDFPELDDGIALAGNCVLRRSGHVSCWDVPRFSEPTIRSTIELDDWHNVVDLAATREDLCALMVDGHVECRSVEKLDEPAERIDVENVIEIDGDALMCGRSSSGRVSCWGPNWGGILGAPPSSLLARPTVLM